MKLSTIELGLAANLFVMICRTKRDNGRKGGRGCEQVKRGAWTRVLSAKYYTAIGLHVWWRLAEDGIGRASRIAPGPSRRQVDVMLGVVHPLAEVGIGGQPTRMILCAQQNEAEALVGGERRVRDVPQVLAKEGLRRPDRLW